MNRTLLLSLGLIALTNLLPAWAKPPREILVLNQAEFRNAFLANITPELFDWSYRKHWSEAHTQELWNSFKKFASSIPQGRTAFLWASHDHFDHQSHFTAKRLLMIRDGRLFMVIDRKAKSFPRLDLAPLEARQKFKEGNQGAAILTFEGKNHREELFVTQFSQLIAESQNSTHLLGVVVDNKLLDSEIIPHLDLSIEPASHEYQQSPNVAVLEALSQEQLDASFFQDDHWISPSVESIVSTVIFENEPEQFAVPLPKPFRLSRLSKVIHFITPRITGEELAYLGKNAAIIGVCILILRLLDFPNFGKH